MKRIFSSFIVLLAILSLCGCNSQSQNENQTQNNEAAWLIVEHEHGQNYPYVKDTLTLYCYNNGVWLEDVDGNKYALNGIAINLLKNNQQYKGTTEKILKQGKSDLYTPDEAMQHCLNLSEGEFSSMMK